MKGYNQKDISFSLLKKNFYENRDIIIDNYNYIEKSDLILKEKLSAKRFSLANYDKRKFINNKKNTIPYVFKNGEYF
jgi:hypothetical protein